MEVCITNGHNFVESESEYTTASIMFCTKCGEVREIKLPELQKAE